MRREQGRRQAFGPGGRRRTAASGAALLRYWTLVEPDWIGLDRVEPDRVVPCRAVLPVTGELDAPLGGTVRTAWPGSGAHRESVTQRRPAASLLEPARSARNGTERNDTEREDTERNDTVWNRTKRHSTARHGTERHGTARLGTEHYA